MRAGVQIDLRKRLIDQLTIALSTAGRIQPIVVRKQTNLISYHCEPLEDDLPIVEAFAREAPLVTAFALTVLHSLTDQRPPYPVRGDPFAGQHPTIARW